MVSNKRQKTVLFFPLNSPGHINSSLGIADRIKQEFGIRTVFLILGKMMSNCIREHEHELYLLDEVNPYEDYEIEEGEDPEQLDEALKISQGKSKVKFDGAYKWPQVILRTRGLMRKEPIEAFINSCDIMEKLMVSQLIDNYDNYAKAIETIAPDMVIIDAYYVPPCIVKLKDIPWIRLFSANPLMILESKLPGGVRPTPMTGSKLMSKQERARIRSEEPEKWEAILEGWRAAQERIVAAIGKAGGRLQDFLLEHGLEPLPPGQQAHNSPHLNIYMFPAALDYDKDDDLFSYPARWFRCDSLVRSSQSQVVEQKNQLWLNKLTAASLDKEAVVLFSLGSLASGDATLMRRFVEMLSTDKKRLYVVSKGVNGHMFDLNEENMIGDKYIPQTLVLENANLAIIHGGNNSVTECMHYGLPMIVLPLFADQLDNAQRVEDLGFGRRLDVYNCTREELLGAVDQLLGDKVLIERMREIGNSMRANNNLGKISLMINKLVNQETLDHDFIKECQEKNINEIMF